MCLIVLFKLLEIYLLKHAYVVILWQYPCFAFLLDDSNNSKLQSVYHRYLYVYNLHNICSVHCFVSIYLIYIHSTNSYYSMNLFPLCTLNPCHLH